MTPKPQVQLKALNNLRVSSVAEFFITVTTDEELVAALDWARARQLPVTPLGEGSNVVLRPYVPGLVVQLATTGVQLLYDDGQRVKLRVAAGENWHALVRWSHRQGFYGLENLALIPGSVGAAPVQNIGAYGVEAAAFIESVRVCQLTNGERLNMSAEQCGFGYRTSVFKRNEGKELIILSVDLVLDRRAQPVANYPALAEELAHQPVTPASVLKTVMALRTRKLPNPALAPNVGSFFKNPTVSWHDAEVISMRWPKMPQFPTDDGQVKLSAAWMIDQLGWRGQGSNGARIASEHALIMINESGETIEPVLALAQQVMDSVEREFGIPLHIEPDVLGVMQAATP